MFYEFTNQEERRMFGGTAFIELQYCKMSKNVKIDRLLAIRNSKHWENDSLYIYVDDIDLFIENYREILSEGTYCNLELGLFDIYGNNYYNPIQVEEIIKRINEKKPIEYNKILKWLEKGSDFNGFYLRGI